MVIDVYLRIVCVSSGNCYMKSHTLSQQGLYLNDDDVSCGNGFIISYNQSQCNESNYFNDMDGGVENVNMNGVHGSMNIHTLYQYNGLISLNNSNNSDDI